jgi:hypothetical protein
MAGVKAGSIGNPGLNDFFREQDVKFPIVPVNPA